MDNFTSKFSQKINTQEYIEANFMADMVQKEQLKKQLQEYEAILQGMRDLYLKHDENNEALLDMTKKLEEGLASVKAEMRKSTAANMKEDMAYLLMTAQTAADKSKYGMIAGIIAVLVSCVNLAVILLIHYGVF